MSDIEQRLREAMHGVTKGPWTHYCAPLRRGLSIINEVQGRGKTPVVSWSGFDDSSRSKIGHKRNAAYIALCSPDNIGALLDTIAYLRSMLEEAEGAQQATPAEQFARWLEIGPKLALASDCYVEIKVRALREADHA